MADNKVIFMRSSKMNGNKSVEGDSSTNGDDIWDDRLLIKAYDKAVQLAQQSYLNKKQNPNSEGMSEVKMGGEQKWKVGDKCRCRYSGDRLYYEAEIIKILDSLGMCVVKYVGYENEETVNLRKLQQSAGETSRAIQYKQALEKNVVQSSPEFDSGAQSSPKFESGAVKNTGKKSQSVPKNSSSTKKGQFKKRNDHNENNSFPLPNFSLPQIRNPIIPPPPPPHIFNKLNEDENETEAMSAMLMSWYMSGYHTGYYQGLKMAKKQ